MPSKRSPLAHSRAFTLVETMIAIVALFLALLGMLAVVPFGFNNVQTNSIQIQAVAIAQQYLDDERNAKLHAVAMPSATSVPVDPGQSFLANGVTNSNYGNFTVSPNGCATVKLTGSVGGGGVNTYDCSVAVSWTQNSVSRSVTVQSYVTK